MDTGGANDFHPDRFVIELSDEAWDEFIAILDRPLEHKPNLARLVSEPTIFG